VEDVASPPYVCARLCALKCFGRGRGQDGLGMGASAGHGCRTWCRTVAEAASHLQCWCLARAARAGPRVSSNMHCGRLP